MHVNLLQHIIFYYFISCVISQIKHNGKSLKDSSFETINTIGIQMCLQRCKRHSTCKSVNYVNSVLQCELNQRNSTDDPALVVNGMDVILIDIGTWEGITDDPCKSTQCQAGSRCIDLRSGSTKCIPAVCVISQLGIKNEKDVQATIVSIGKTVNRECKTGYIAKGTTQSTCRPDGTLTPVSFTCYREVDSWILAFRGQSNIGYSDYSAFIQTGVRHEVNTSIPDECSSFTKSTACPYHYRTGILDDWNELQIQQVLFSVYKNGTKVNQIIFNGTGSTYLDWFQPGRILSSTWTDLTAGQSYNYFSVNGHTDGSFIERRFFIAKAYDGCNGDTGYVSSSLRNKTGNCAFDIRSTTDPSYLVCPKTTLCVLNSETTTADFFAVFIKSSLFGSSSSMT